MCSPAARALSQFGGPRRTQMDRLFQQRRQGFSSTSRPDDVATRSGTDPERLVKDVLASYLDDEARFLAAVEKGIAAAERGEFIEEEEMDARAESMFKP